jgi:hypothetical protein
MHDPVDTAKELLLELKDKPDPSLNYIKALEVLIEVAELARCYPDSFAVAKVALQQFPDQYEKQAS